MKILTVLAGLCLVFTFVWERVDMVRVGYQIERLKHDKALLERERDELRVKFQVLQAAELTLRADRQHQKTVSLEGARGTIVDRHGKVLAMNMEVPSVFGVPTALESPAKTARHLSSVLRVSTGELERKLRQDRGFVLLARELGPEHGRGLEHISMDGIGVVMEGRRFYPKGPLLSHVLGFAGMDGEGLEGIERRYETQLHGEKRDAVLQRDALGRTVFPKGL